MVGVFTMLRGIGLVIAAAGFFLAPATASAQTAQAAEASCPRAPVSVYFASGDVTGSPEAQALLVRIGDTAARCEADTIDLIAHIDPQADGDRAVTVALERLNKIARDLIARGLPAGRIRIAARAPEPGEPVAGPNQINVVIRKSEDAPPASPQPPSRLTQPATPAFSI
jgi:outer membrane protein OmpA-like peptidoglycan-associated protein